jgi:hypothetical protein
MYEPKILVLGLAVAISLFSLTHINLAFAQDEEQTDTQDEEQTEGFTAELLGGEEVPPVETTATGIASFTTEGEESIKYDVNVTDMDKVTAAHIHSAPKGENGDIVVTLFKADSPTGPKSGSLANGTITADMLEGPMQGGAVLDLIKAMERGGETYVNVHTEANPKGEIRGQIGAVP